MAIILNSDEEGLFDRLGALGKVLRDANAYAATTAAANVAAALDQFDEGAAAVPGLVSSLSAALTSHQASVAGIGPTLQQIAQQTVLRMVKDDSPQASDTDLSLALKEVIRQMRANAQTVKASTVAATPAAVSGNTGDGVLAAHVERGDGLTSELLFAELARAACVADAYTGGATSGNEQFQFRGQPAVSNAFAETWPGGSGANVSLSAADGSKDNASGNLLTNSDFEDFTSNTPANWTITVGTAGTQVLKSTATFYDGLASLQFVGGATQTALTQTFNVTSAGTAGTLRPNTVYGVNFWGKVDVVPAAGTLTVELIDGSGAIVEEDQEAVCSFTIDLPSLTTSFVAYSGFIQTPKLLPTTVKLRLRLNNALSSGSNFFLDRLAMTAATAAYAGGPCLALFAGATPFLLGDGFTLTTTNNRGGASYNATFQALFDRFFNLRQLGLLLPSAASPTIADSLIS